MTKKSVFITLVARFGLLLFIWMLADKPALAGSTVRFKLVEKYLIIVPLTINDRGFKALAGPERGDLLVVAIDADDDVFERLGRRVNYRILRRKRTMARDVGAGQRQRDEDEQRMPHVPRARKSG